MSAVRQGMYSLSHQEGVPKLRTISAEGLSTSGSWVAEKVKEFEVFQNSSPIHSPRSDLQRSDRLERKVSTSFHPDLRRRLTTSKTTPTIPKLELDTTDQLSQEPLTESRLSGVQKTCRLELKIRQEGTMYPFEHPRKNDIEHLRDLMRERCSYSAERRFKYETDNYLLIMNEEGELKWVTATDDIMTPRALIQRELVQRAVNAFRYIVNLIRESYEMGFHRVVYKRVTSYKQRGSLIEDSKKVRTTLIDMFKELHKSRSGIIVENNDLYIKRKMEQLYWVSQLFEMELFSRSVLHLFEECHDQLMEFITVMEKRQEKEVNKLKRKSTLLTPDVLFERLGLKKDIDQDEKQAIFNLIQEKPKCLLGYDGTKMKAYRQVFEGVREKSNTLIEHRNSLFEKGLHESSKDDLSDVIFNKYLGPQQDVRKYLLPFPKMLKVLLLRTCELIKSSHKREDMIKTIQISFNKPIQWEYLITRIHTLHKLVTSKSRRRRHTTKLKSSVSGKRKG